MATITYQCSVCNRTIDILEKPANVNVFAKCVITNGCRGKLNKLSRNPDNNRESFPAPVLGLQDYVQRKAFYEHNQQILNSVWNIQHDLGAVPAVDVFIQTDASSSSLTKLNINDYKISIIDKNTCNITLGAPYRGIAHLVARTSNQEFDILPTTSIDLFKVTYGGIFVFAIPKYLTKFEVPPQPPLTPADLPLDLNNADIRLRVSVIEPNKEEIICIERVNLKTLNSTPWVGWKEILLRKRRNYYIRYKSIFSFTSTFELDTVSSQDIPDGTQVKFLEIDFGTGSFQPIEQGDLLLLLANPPYQSIDKIRNKIIDVGAMIKNDYDYFLYQGGELYTSTSNIQNTYPQIDKAPPIPTVTPTPSTTRTSTPMPSHSATPTATPTITPTRTSPPTPTPSTTHTAPVTITPTITPTHTPTVTPTQSQIPVAGGISQHSQILLNDGTVLITGGVDNNGNSLAIAQIYDPIAKTFTRIADMNYIRISAPSLVLLPDNNVLLAGTTNTVDYAIELYDSTAKTFTILTPSTTPGGNINSAYLLSTGKIILLGAKPDNGANGTINLFDYTDSSLTDISATSSTVVDGDTFSSILSTNRLFTKLPNNKYVTSIVTATDVTSNPFKYYLHAYFFDDSSNIATYTTMFSIPSTLANNTGFSTVLGNNIVLGLLDTTNQCVLYNYSSDQMTYGPNLNESRAFPAISLLNNENLVVFGGYDPDNNLLGSAEIYNYTANTFTNTTGNLIVPRGDGAAATLLNDGTVLITGGSINGGSTNTAEIYNPTTETFTLLSNRLIT